MNKALSAKDKAFENERAKYRRQIREYEQAIRNQAVEELTLRKQLQQANSKIQEQEEWILRLLEYMDMSPEEFKSKIKSQNMIKLGDDILPLFGVLRAIDIRCDVISTGSSIK